MSIDQGREKSIKNYATVLFAVIIAIIGWVMMTVTSSPQMKGAAMLWIPAAFQLIAGVWLGPTRGLIAGGLGAYFAGIFAYGGWGIVDIIMNPIAGGIANSWLPGILFLKLKIDPSFNANHKDLKKGIFVILSLLIFVVFIGLLPLYFSISYWSYLIATIVLIISAPLLLMKLEINKRDLIFAVLIVIVISFISAVIGTFGVVVGGNTWEAAAIGTGLGWFLGDTVSALLGLYMLAFFTKKARERGIA